MSKTRVAVIGAGGLANMMHYPSLVEFDDVEICGICDLMPDKLAATADKFNITNRYSDYKKMIAEQDPEAVYAIMPPQHLYEPASHILEAGKHLFVEKPPAMSITQLANLARKADKHGCLTMAGFNRRFTPLILACKERCEARGSIDLASVTFAKYHTAGEYYNGVIDILTCDAIHAVDLVRFLCGGEVDELASSVREVGGEPYPNSWQALMTFDNGATGILIAHWMAGRRLHHCEMHSRGVTAYTEFEVDAEIWSDGKAEGERLDAKELAGSDQVFKTFGFYGENRHFIDCIQSGDLPSSWFGDAIKTMELVDRIYHESFLG